MRQGSEIYFVLSGSDIPAFLLFLLPIILAGVNDIRIDGYRAVQSFAYA